MKGELIHTDSQVQKTSAYNDYLLKSVFSLCPSGSGPNSIRLWESLGIGTIPVVLADTLDLPKHELMEKAIIQVENRVEATSQLAQTTLRSVLGRHELDDMLSEREKLNSDVQEILDQNTEAWGIKVTNVEIKHVDLDESMIRAIAAQAEAERARRAKVIHAEGEFQASQKLAEAADVLGSQSQALQLRYLQTLTEISSERNTNTIVFPLPLDLIKPIFDKTTESKNKN